VEETLALRNYESVALLHQWGVPKGEHRGIVSQRPNRFVDIVLLHCRQVAKSREETRMLERAPKGGCKGGTGRRMAWGRLLVQDHPIKEVSVSKPSWARFVDTALRPPTKRNSGLWAGQGAAEEASVDDIYGFRHSNESCALSGGSHAVKRCKSVKSGKKETRRDQQNFQLPQSSRGEKNGARKRRRQDKKEAIFSVGATTAQRGLVTQVPPAGAFFTG